MGSKLQIAVRDGELVATVAPCRGQGA
ncbi:hypothetical protein [Xanthomonas arboricola]